jgi:SAM-dependent methyltransferase
VCRLERHRQLSALLDRGGYSGVGALDNQLGYWNTAGTAKRFGHPVEPTWLDEIDRQARILDYGCGYGRLSGLLAERGSLMSKASTSPPPSSPERGRCGRPRDTMNGHPAVATQLLVAKT